MLVYQRVYANCIPLIPTVSNPFPKWGFRMLKRSVSATVDYVIDPPTHSMDEMLWLTNTAHSNLLSESW